MHMKQLGHLSPTTSNGQMRTWWSSCRTATLLAVCVLLGAASGSSQTPSASASAVQDAAGSAPTQPTRTESPQDEKLRIIAFGAHPDDCEFAEAGTAAKWAAKGLVAVAV